MAPREPVIVAAAEARSVGWQPRDDNEVVTLSAAKGLRSRDAERSEGCEGGALAPTNAAPGMAWPGRDAWMHGADDLFVLRRSLTRSFGLRPQDDNVVVTLSAAKGLP